MQEANEVKRSRAVTTRKPNSQRSAKRRVITTEEIRHCAEDGVSITVRSRPVTVNFSQPGTEPTPATLPAPKTCRVDVESPSRSRLLYVRFLRQTCSAGGSLEVLSESHNKSDLVEGYFEFAWPGFATRTVPRREPW